VPSAPPAQRPKRRYIAFQLLCEARVSMKEVVEAISSEALSFFGESKVAELGIWLLDFSEETGKGYLVCNHRYKGEVIACLSLISSISGREASFIVLGVSGTIRSLKRKFLKDDTEMWQEGE